MSEKYSLDHIVSAGNWSYYTYGSSFCMPRLLQTILSSDDKVLKNISVSGTLTKTLPELLDLIKSFKGRVVVSNSNGLNVFVFPDYSYIDVDFSEKSKAVSITGNYLDPEIAEIQKILEKDFVSKTKKNLIFSIVRTQSGLEIRNMGDGSSPLIKENYHPEVMEELDYVLSAFKKNPPTGRICILNGEPGTGKTHLVRSILSQLDSVFLIVPSNLIDSLDKPEFMPLLLNIKNEHEKPIIMIIEDGDVCLVPRKNDNISAVSALLNLSDGILGSIIDIKMIISTNAEIRDMDQAIMRPGRLCKNITVGPLPYEQANKVYQRITSDDTAHLPFKKYYTLAEIYNLHNGKDLPQVHSSPPKRSIGFSSSRSCEDSNVDRTLNSINVK